MGQFETTRWSIVLQARAGPVEARGALEKLCRTYRAPVLAYIRRRTGNADDADDLAQTFFTSFVADSLHAKMFRLNPRNAREERVCEACHGPARCTPRTTRTRS